jgi:hypothetical protein
MKIKYIYITGLILFILTIIIVIIITLTASNEKYIDYTSNVYLSREETANIIKNDSDKYIRNLTKYDLYARDVSTPEEYIYKIIEGCLNFSEKQVIKLNNCSKIARKFFDNKYIWKFALIDEVYEEGFPHTRMDIIFLSPKVISYTDDNLTRILIHESIHIYQRYNITEINKYLKDNKYTVSRRRDSEPLMRANPDLDEYIYKDRDGEEMLYKYKSSMPQGINDIVPSKNEHPFEKMAYEISEDYGRFKISKYINI